MFQVDLDAVKTQGIDAIINLCGEFCDLHEIQTDSGFEVYYLPVPDECAPDMEAMELAFKWLDNRLAEKRKVLVHCRFGMGRTGTFITAYGMIDNSLGLLTEGMQGRSRILCGQTTVTKRILGILLETIQREFWLE